MSVISVIVKHPVLPPCAVDGRSTNPLYYYYYYYTILIDISEYYHILTIFTKEGAKDCSLPANPGSPGSPTIPGRPLGQMPQSSPGKPAQQNVNTVKQSGLVV